jgi:flagellar biosynthesis/type III secretory pathway M-ring protein FliF/YscJ
VLVIIIGLVLLIVAAVFGLDLIWKNHYTVRSPALFGQTLGIHNAAEFFIIGAIAGAILLLGIAMMLAGLRRKAVKARRHRAERKEARNAGRDREQAQEENDELRSRLDRDAGVRSSGATAAD